MISRRERSVLFVSVIALGLCADACSRPQPAGQPRLDVRMGGALATTPATGAGLAVLVDLLTSDNLITTGVDGRQVATLAREWTWSPDGTVLHLKLRRDVVFHDGTQLTPGIAAEALRMGLKGSPFLPSNADIISIATTGEDGVDIHLSRPDSFLLSDLNAVSIVLPQKQDVRTGPFRVVAQDRQSAKLEAFDKYFRGKPTVRAVQISTYATQRKAWAAMMRGEIDALHDVSRDAVDFVEAETSVSTYTFARPYYVAVVFNENHPVLKSAAVRRAIAQAVDKEVIVREGLHSRGRPADGPVWPAHWAYRPVEAAARPDAEGAKHLLDAAGYPMRPAAKGTMPSRFTFKCEVFAEDARYERVAVLLQKQLFDIGIDMQLEPVNLRTLGRKAQTGDFDAILFEFASARSLNWVNIFWHSHGLLNTGYSAADGALDRIRSAMADDETIAATTELQRVLQEDPPALFLAWLSQARAVSARIDVGAQPGRDIIATLWQWRLKPPAQQASR